jgi:hypothetical protein
MSTQTSMAPGNRNATMLDLGTLEDGDVITVSTKSSRWTFVLAKGRRVVESQIIGVSVMTNSRKFGQITADAMNTRIDRIFHLGEPISVNGGNSGNIRFVSVNGERRLG